MHFTRTFQQKSAAVMIVALSALAGCGGDQAKPNAAPAPSASSADDQLLAQLAADAGLDELLVTDAGSTAPSGPQITTDAGLVKSNNVTADNSNDECGGPSAKFEGVVRAKFNDCYQEGKKKNPDLAGEIRITVSIDYKGKITSVKNSGGKELGDKVIACMVTAVKKTPFEGSEACKSKAIIVGKKWGQ